MRLKNILLVVEDVEKSIAFYKELFGLQVLKDFDGHMIEIGEMKFEKCN